MTNSQQIAGNAGQSYLAAFNNGITYYRDPARFPFTGTNEVKAIYAALFFGRLGVQIGGHFETKGGRGLARRLARGGRDVLDGLFDAAQDLLNTCKNVRGLSGDLQAMQDLRDAAQFAEVTYGAFFQGVLNGLAGTEA